MRSPRTLGFVATASVLLSTVAPLVANAAGPEDVLPTRATAPVVLTGAQLPTWSRLAATGTPNPYPSGALTGERSAHNGTIVVPPDARAGVDPEKIAAYRWDGDGVRRDPRPGRRALPLLPRQRRTPTSASTPAPTRSSPTSGTSSPGRGRPAQCAAEYPAGEGRDGRPGPDARRRRRDRRSWRPTPAARPRPPRSGPSAPRPAPARRSPSLDPLNARTSATSTCSSSDRRQSFDADHGYVHYERDANADQWIDRDVLRRRRPREARLVQHRLRPEPRPAPSAHPDDGRAAPSTDRFPRDGVTVTTDTYKWYASGRWMVRGMQVAKPGQPGVYGPDLIDRWKGRAFQQSPDSTISVVGFEDEQVNWEANSALLGERDRPGAGDPRDLGRRLRHQRHQDRDLLPRRRHVPLPRARAPDPAGRPLHVVGLQPPASRDRTTTCCSPRASPSTA